MPELNDKIAAEIADMLRTNGYSTCTPEDVWSVQRHGVVEQGGVSDEYDNALTDQIFDQLDSRRIKTP